MNNKKIILGICIILIVLVGMFFYWIYSYSHLFVIVGPKEKIVREKMSDPNFCEQFAHKLALYCQSVNERIGIGYYPEIAGELPINSGFVSPEGALLRLRGGFDHFGYNLLKDEDKSTQDENVWVFSSYGDRTEELCTITINKTEKISLPEIEIVN